jgi:hypothetical protein
VVAVEAEIIEAHLMVLADLAVAVLALLLVEQLQVLLIQVAAEVVEVTVALLGKMVALVDLE